MIDFREKSTMPTGFEDGIFETTIIELKANFAGRKIEKMARGHEPSFIRDVQHRISDAFLNNCSLE